MANTSSSSFDTRVFEPRVVELECQRLVMLSGFERLGFGTYLVTSEDVARVAGPKPPGKQLERQQSYFEPNVICILRSRQSS